MCHKQTKIRLTIHNKFVTKHLTTSFILIWLLTRVAPCTWLAVLPVKRFDVDEPWLAGGDEVALIPGSTPSFLSYMNQKEFTKVDSTIFVMILTNDATLALSFSAVILRITAVGVNDNGLDDEADCFADDC